ncbi:hypothetical protein D039_1436A, partial [Vibrio parahaemolyticus EKP-028]
MWAFSLVYYGYFAQYKVA